MDLLLDETTHDVVWNNGPLTKEYTTQPFTQNVAQRLKIRLLTYQNEWFMDEEYGIPYFTRILGQKGAKSVADNIFQQNILDERGVAEITRFNSTLNNRAYSLSFAVRCVNGDEVSVTLPDIGA